MDDLFKLFPDLPWLPGRAIVERVRQARERKARVSRVKATAEQNAARIRTALKRRKKRS
jgi:hypothetical protein